MATLTEEKTPTLAGRRNPLMRGRSSYRAHSFKGSHNKFLRRYAKRATVVTTQLVLNNQLIQPSIASNACHNATAPLTPNFGTRLQLMALHANKKLLRQFRPNKMLRMLARRAPLLSSCQHASVQLLLRFGVALALVRQTVIKAPLRSRFAQLFSPAMLAGNFNHAALLKMSGRSNARSTPRTASQAMARSAVSFRSPRSI